MVPMNKEQISTDLNHQVKGLQLQQQLRELQNENENLKMDYSKSQECIRKAVLILEKDGGEAVTSALEVLYSINKKNIKVN